MKLDVEWLKVFAEVYRTRSVSRAAERLSMAQANASIALRKLRAYFGDPLFSRTSTGMEATPHADALYPEVVAVLDRLVRLVESGPTFNAAVSTRAFRICMTDISEVVMLPRMVNHLHLAAPGVQIESVRISSGTQRELESGAVDLAVGFMPQLEAGFYQQVLFQQDFVCLAALNHPRIRSKPGKQAFLAEGHIQVASSGTGHAIVDKTLRQRGYDRRVEVRVPSFLGVARLVATTELLVIVPRRLGESFAQQEALQLLPPPVPLPAFAVKQHWHQRFHKDPGNSWLRSAVAQLGL